MTKHLVIPDVQVDPNHDFSYLSKVGELIVKEKPDVIVCIGDFADMASLSSFDAPGTKQFEGKRYRKDLDATHLAMQTMLTPLWNYQQTRIDNKKKRYKPRMVMTLGNHEHRINRAIDKNPNQLDGIISMEDLAYEDFGWEVFDFLDRVTIDGVTYSHYFINPTSLFGRPIGGTIDTKLKAIGHSFTMGHQQTLQFGVMPRKDGMIQGLVAGACYLHDEEYLGPQGNDYWRGVIIKDNVEDGRYDPRFIHLNNLIR